jgi:hypothetical protein
MWCFGGKIDQCTGSNGWYREVVQLARRTLTDLVVVETDPLVDADTRFKRIGIGLQVHLFVLQAAPQTLGEDVVQPDSRPHQTLAYQPPAAVWAAEVSDVDLPLLLVDAGASPTTPQRQQPQNEIHI